MQFYFYKATLLILLSLPTFSFLKTTNVEWARTSDFKHVHWQFYCFNLVECLERVFYKRLQSRWQYIWARVPKCRAVSSRRYIEVPQIPCGSFWQFRRIELRPFCQLLSIIFVTSTQKHVSFLEASTLSSLTNNYIEIVFVYSAQIGQFSLVYLVLFAWK